jgi:hypothetical protein
MAMTSILINTIQVTQSILSHLSRSLDLNVDGKNNHQVLNQPQSITSNPPDFFKNASLVAAPNPQKKSSITMPVNQLYSNIPNSRKVNTVKIFKDIAGSKTGRMALTGRMSDVCAELERMAANETSIQPAQRTLWH